MTSKANEIKRVSVENLDDLSVYIETIFLAVHLRNFEPKVGTKFIMDTLTDKFHIIPKTDDPSKCVEIRNGILKWREDK